MTHAQHRVSNEHPKGEDTNVAECAACQCGPKGETPVLPPPVSAGKLGELIERLGKFIEQRRDLYGRLTPIDEIVPAMPGLMFGDIIEAAQARQSLQQKLKEWQGKAADRNAEADKYAKRAWAAEEALASSHSTVEQMAKALEKAATTLEDYADPSVYTDNLGDPYPADAVLHPGLGAAATLVEVKAALSLKKENAHD